MFPISSIDLLLLLPVSQAGFYFQNWGFSISDAQKPLAITIALIVFLFLAAVARTLYRRARGTETAGLSIHDPGQILEVLDGALEERATLEVHFQDEDTQRTNFTCSLAKFEPSVGITLEVSAYIKPLPSWVGRTVRCFFKISGQLKESKWSFFSFKSTITDIVVFQSRQHIVLIIPKQLDRNQRREHLRLDPPNEDIPEIHIWPETFSNPEWPEADPPILEYHVAYQENPLRVLNISAGGLLLELDTLLPKALGTDLEKGHRFYIRLVLRNLDGGSPHVCQLLAQVRNIFLDPTRGKRLVGLSFVAHLPLTEGSKRWTSLNAKGVDEIDDWVFRRHLELYREKGLA